MFNLWIQGDKPAYYEDSALTPEHYKTAIQSQDACNVRALLEELAGIYKLIKGGSRAQGTHPCSLLYVHQIMSLTFGEIVMDLDYYEKVLNYCKERMQCTMTQSQKIYRRQAHSVIAKVLEGLLVSGNIEKYISYDFDQKHANHIKEHLKNILDKHVKWATR